MSYDLNFCNNLRKYDIDLYRRATLAERFAKKLRKHKLDLKFFATARDTGVYPKFTHWKNVKNNKKCKSKFYCCVLLDEINNKRRSIKELRKELCDSMKVLSSSTTFFKSIILRISIN